MKRKELINEVLTQILQDVKNFDLTAIEELILNIPDEALMAYLPEETQGELK
jgi:D-ribose pyranose/furanose isomerase RbsD